MEYSKRLFEGSAQPQEEDAVVYRDEHYTLGREGELPFLIAGGRRYRLTCHPYEPCLYITDENGAMTAVHNAFDPVVVLDAFHKGDAVTSITGRKYNAKDFCRMVEYAAQMIDVGIDDAEKVFGDRKQSGTTQKRFPAENADNRFADTTHGADSSVLMEEAAKNRCPKDPFYDLLAAYPDCVVDYCIVKNDCADSGRDAHQTALERASRILFFDGKETVWRFDVTRADASKITPEWLFSSEDGGDRLTYRRAFLCPPDENGYTKEDFDRINRALFPNGTDELEVYEWTTDWSEYFDDGHEWWGALCITVYDRSLDRFVVIMASATD